MSFIGATGFTEYELRFQQIEDAVYIDKNDISKLYILSSNLSNNLYIGDTSITSNIINIKSYLYNGDTSITSNIIYIKNELQNETQITPTKTAIYRVKDLEDRFSQIANGYNNGNIIDPQTGQIISNTISAAFSAIGASIANIGNVAAIWYFLGQCAIASQVGQTRAETANNKADRLLDIWEDSGNNVYHKKSGNVGIGTGFGSTLNNRLEVNGNINITNGNKYKINGYNLAYSNLDGFLPDSISSNFITHPILNSCNYIKTLPIATQASLGIIQVGANLSITPEGVLNANATPSIPLATTTTTGIIQVGTGLSITAQGLLSVPIATNGILGGVKPDVDTIIVNPSTGLISLSGSDILLNGTANRYYGWASSTSLLGRVAVAGSYSTSSIINDVVLRSAGNLILQSGITTPSLVINATNQALFRNAVGIGTATISTGNILDVEGILKIATGAGTERLTITSTGVQVNHTLNVSTGFNAGGLIRLGGFADDSSLDLAIIQNREYVANKSELLLFKGDNIEGTTGTDRIRLRAGAIAFDTYSTDATTSAITENIRMYIDGNGRVGIGITNPPFSLLHLNKTATLQDVRLQFTDGTSTSVSNRGLAIGKGSDNRSFIYNYENTALFFGTNSAERMTIGNTGNVGIGMSTPVLNILHLHKTATAQKVSIALTDGTTTTSANRGFQIIKGDDGNGNLYNFENKDLAFGTNGEERMRILAGGNINIDRVLKIGGIDNYNGGLTTKLQVYASDDTGTIAIFKHPNNTQGIGIRYNEIYGTNTNQNVNITTTGTGQIYFYANGAERMRVYTDGSVRTPYGGAFIAQANISRGNGYDIRSICTSTGMYIEMGTAETFSPTYLRMGAYESGTFIESNSNRSIIFRIWSGVNTGTLRAWDFNINGGSYNNFNTTTWQQASDQRIKENIVKADLKKCYDNVKNINLYRYNYIDSFQTGSEDKNKLGYIAQEVKIHFPKATYRKKERLLDKREIPDLLTIDVEQINLTLYGAVKQLIKIVEKQNKRIKTLETLLNIDDNDDVENDAGEAYQRIYDDEEVDIDTIEPNMGVSPPSDDGGGSEPSTEV